MLTRISPLPYVPLSPYVSDVESEEEDFPTPRSAEYEKITEWVSRIDWAKNNSFDAFYRELLQTPVADIHPDLAKQEVGKKLEASFNGLCIREYKKILIGMNEILKSLLSEREYTPAEIRMIKSQVSPRKFLFEVIKQSLESKGLQKDFFALSEFQSLIHIFQRLRLRGLLGF